MSIGIMQPYFFPYIGYFALIARTDVWIVFDITQYTPKTWMNRNRILHPNKGWNYVTVPLQNSSISIKIYEARIMDVSAAHKSVLGKISHYKKKAPFYYKVEALINEAFGGEDDDSLVHLNVRGLKAVCNYLEIPFNYHICSKMDLQLPETMPAGKWAPTISKLLGANKYINPVGGRHLFDPADFAAGGIELSFLEMPEFIYNTEPYQFESGLSILDVLLWNAPSKVRKAIDHVRIIP